MSLISFRISGSFAAFKDPSITSNQVVYYIPSKSAVVGILGALTGIPRSNRLEETYSQEYLDFFKNIKIGLQFESKPEKIVFFTNHRSLKEDKTKPFKSEVVVDPSYTIFVDTNKEIQKKLSYAILNNELAYTPYLGHAYCPAHISDFKQRKVKEIDNVEDCVTKCVILDESEEQEQDKDFRPDSSAQVIVERHKHHFFEDGDKFVGRILKHWIPTEGTELTIDSKNKKTLTKFYRIKNNVICMY